MEERAVEAVERTIQFMRQNLADRITVDDMARAAKFSKFYFTRLFRRATGASPARYLSALRLEEAMRLLLNSSWTVADISHQVGYNSPGTFSSRFRRSVGVSPIAFRQLGGYLPHFAAQDRARRANRAGTTVRGNMHVADGGPGGHTFVGIFRGPVPQGPPASWVVLPRPGPFVLNDVRDGTWCVHAQAVAPVADATTTAPQKPGGAPYVGSCGPIVVHPETPITAVELLLRPRRAFDPQVLLAPVEVRSGPARDFGAENARIQPRFADTYLHLSSEETRCAELSGPLYEPTQV